MKTFNALSISLGLMLAFFVFPTHAQTTHTASMGNQYVNEVFFSLTQGEVKNSARNTWDLAFFTNAFSAGVMINDGAGVALYTYPYAANDGWETFDTTGMGTWKRLYNNCADYEDGAFNRNALGHPDYGWGIYNMTSHSVTGDSLYLIKPLDGVYRKFQIVKKISTENKYIIRYAFLDGSNDKTDTLSINQHTDKLTMAFSFTGGIVDREPAKDSWDLLFTRYHTMVQSTYYPVNGVLTNKSNVVAQVHPVAIDFTDWVDLEYLPQADVIGHDWKTINMTTFQWDITDSLAYFIKTQNESIYKVVFEAFSGSGTGTSTFSVQALVTASAGNLNAGVVSIYPNPATEVIKVELREMPVNASAAIYDLSGRMVKQQQLSSSLLHEISLDYLVAGTYILRLTDNNRSASYKILVH